MAQPWAHDRMIAWAASSLILHKSQQSVLQRCCPTSEQRKLQTLTTCSDNKVYFRALLRAAERTGMCRSRRIRRSALSPQASLSLLSDSPNPKGL